jgi:hypothetical protein
MTCGVANYTLLYSKQLSNITKIYTGTRSTMRVRTSQKGEARSYLKPIKYKQRRDREHRIYTIFKYNNI